MRRVGFNVRGRAQLRDAYAERQQAALAEIDRMSPRQADANPVNFLRILGNMGSWKCVRREFTDIDGNCAHFIFYRKESGHVIVGIAYKQDRSRRWVFTVLPASKFENKTNILLAHDEVPNPYELAWGIFNLSSAVGAVNPDTGSMRDFVNQVTRVAASE